MYPFNCKWIRKAHVTRRTHLSFFLHSNFLILNRVLSKLHVHFTFCYSCALLELVFRSFFIFHLISRHLTIFSSASLTRSFIAIERGDCISLALQANIFNLRPPAGYFHAVSTCKCHFFRLFLSLSPSYLFLPFTFALSAWIASSIALHPPLAMCFYWPLW